MSILTIVVPCYNAENYIINLLNSLNNQTDTDFELIFIDDCSDDNTVSIIEKYNFNKNIKYSIFKNENNCGPGTSRNKGIQYANGRYITFIDSDDCVDNRFVSLCKQKIFEYKDLDCLVFDFCIKSDKKTKKRSMYIGVNKPAEEALLAPKEAMVYVLGATCGKVYRTEMIKNNGIEFLPYYRGEDIPFTKSALALSDRILYIQDPIYYYCVQSNSIMHSISTCPVNEVLERIDYIKDKTSDKNILETEAIFVLNCLYSLVKSSIKSKNDIKEINHMINNLEHNYPNWYKNLYIKKYPLKYRIVFFLIHHRFLCLLKLLSKLF